MIHVPRTGGTSIEVALTGQGWDEIDLYAKHLTADQARFRYLSHWKSYFTFSIVRNPFDRLVSVHADIARQIGDPSFEEFILGGEWHMKWEQPYHNQYDMIRGVDKVYRFEDLEGAWADLSERLGINKPLPHTCQNRRRRDWRSYYTPRARGTVERLCRRDMEHFGYSF